MALNLDQPVTFERLTSGSNLMEVPRDTAIALVKKYSIGYDPFLGDMLYTVQSVGNNGRLSFVNFTPPKHVLQARLNACQFRPKGKIGSTQTFMDLSPLEINMTQCPDAFWGGPWERIFGVGNDITNIPQALIDELMRMIFSGIGSSTHEAAEFGQHPVITIADANGYFPIAADVYADYIDQQAAMSGRMTTVDALKDDGLDHYNVDIKPFINTTTGAFTGDIFDLINLVIDSRRSEMQIAEDQMGANVKGIIEMDQVTFNALKAQLLDRFNAIPDVWKLFVEGQSGNLKMTNYLMYQGYAIKPQSAWTAFDATNGVKTRRVMLSYPGVHGIGTDLPSLNENNIALQVEQSPLIRDKGRIDMVGHLKLGTAVLDTNFVVNASEILFPPFVA